jgi:hypothetical protein
MTDLIQAGLTVGVVTVVLCTATITEPLRRRFGGFLHCTFCTSCWLGVSPAFHAAGNPLYNWGSIVAIGSLAVMIIHSSIATTGDDNVERDSEAA